jgi:ATP dependent DNA ligase domain
MPWKSQPRRSRPLTLPVGFVAPCVPVVTARPPTGDEWLHELKYDGYRICARRDGKDVHLWSRHTTDCAANMVRIVAGLRKIRAQSLTVDGEAVVFRQDGSCDFFALRGKEGQASAALVAFERGVQRNGDLRIQRGVQTLYLTGGAEEKITPSATDGFLDVLHIRKVTG